LKIENFNAFLLEKVGREITGFNINYKVQYGEFNITITDAGICILNNQLIT